MRDFDFERYKDFDFSGATRTTNPKILEMRARKKAHDTLLQLFDEDVQQLLAQQQSPQQKARLNAVIRALYAG